MTLGLALLEDGVPTFVLEEERFNREKHTRKFPFRSLKAAFDDRGLDLAGIDVITTPWHMRSLWRMMFGAVREGFPASLNLVPPSARPTQSTLIVTMPNGLRWGLLWHFGVKSKLPKIVQVRHHDAHAAAFFVSPFEEATILVMDGYGDETAQSAYTGAGNRIERVAQTHIFNSLGMLYTAVTEHLGFKYFEEGTVMALAATGDKTYAKKFRELIRLEPGRRILRQPRLHQLPHARPQPAVQEAICRGLWSATREGRAHWRPASRSRLRAPAHGRGNHPSRRSRAVKTAQKSQSMPDRRRGAELRGQRADPSAIPTITRCGCRLALPTRARRLEARLWHYHQTLGKPRKLSR